MSVLYKKRTFHAPGSNLGSGVYESELPSVLRRWRDGDCRLALWRRTLAPPIVQELDRADLEDFPSIRFAARTDEVGRKLVAAFAGARRGDTELATSLVRDMTHLVALFCRATETGEVDVRLEAVRDDACRKFHTDVTYARLVTTYVGPGTVWVPAGHGEEAVRMQDSYAGPLNEMPRFAVGMFGGAAADGGGLVHRSPRIAGTDTFRLFFCVNRPFQSASSAL